MILSEEQNETRQEGREGLREKRKRETDRQRERRKRKLIYRRK
jgi:hypothetical protein